MQRYTITILAMLSNCQGGGFAAPNRSASADSVS